MQDLHSGGGGGGSMQRRPSLPELNSYAGERKGASSHLAAGLLPKLVLLDLSQCGTWLCDAREVASPVGPPPGDERLRRRRAGELDEAWGAGDSAASGPSHTGHILPGAPGTTAQLRC